jgi:hypothetical protein
VEAALAAGPAASAAAPLALAVVALVIVTKLIKPAVKVAHRTAAATRAGRQLDEVVDDDARRRPHRPKVPLKVLQAPKDSDKLEAAPAWPRPTRRPWRTSCAAGSTAATHACS